MDRSIYRENGEQRFPFVLPVLRSYKQSLMFETKTVENTEIRLPEIDKRFKAGAASSFRKTKKKNRFQGKKVGSSLSKTPVRPKLDSSIFARSRRSIN